MAEPKSFDDILISLENLNEQELDTLLYVLDKDKINRNKYILRSKVKKLYFIIFSSVWFVSLIFGGLLEVTPLWFRIILFPLFGLPFIMEYVFEIINYKAKKDFVTFLAISFFVGPVIGFFWGLGLTFIIFFGWEFISQLMG